MKRGGERGGSDVRCLARLHESRSSLDVARHRIPFDPIVVGRRGKWLQEREREEGGLVKAGERDRIALMGSNSVLVEDPRSVSVLPRFLVLLGTG